MSALSDEYCNLLLSTPLFQGMSRADLRDIALRLRLTIQERCTRYVIARADAPCEHLVIVLRGSVRQTTTALDNSYHMTEILIAPLAIQVEYLFGRRMTYSSTFIVASDSIILTLTKHDVLTLYNDYEVFRLNLLNMLVVQLQRTTYRLWTGAHGDLRQRIVLFIMHHCAYPAGQKQLTITMNTLATVLGTSRLSISQELNRLQKDGLLILHRGMITIPALESLYASSYG